MNEENRSQEINFQENKEESFYHETVRNEDIKRNHKKYIIGVFCAAVFCLGFGTLIGMSVSATKSLKNSGLSGSDMIEEIKENSQNIVSSIGSSGEKVEVETNIVAQTPEKEEKEPLSKEIDAVSKNNVNVFKSVSPAIVCITTVSQGMDIFSVPQEISQSGSGVIFAQTSTDAYIVTNYDVIKGAKDVSVSVNGSDTVSVKMVGKEPKSGLVVLSVSKRDLKKAGIADITVAKFGNSDEMNIGDSVMSIGNMLGEGTTATKGTISNNKKEVTISGKKLTVLQTDAAINYGNSGGALVNEKGEVIGINTVSEMYAEAKVEGIDYSISSNVVMPIIEQIMNDEQKPYLGVTIANINAQMAKQYNLPETGVVIVTVEEGGNAYNAGIQSGDIVLSFNDKPVFTAEQLTEAVLQCKIGDKAEMTVLRNGNRKSTVTVKFRENS
ncbi:MAG: trypsin-like peptidase domain-containing protein [Firmicutes bacterium]|nr:trypsin-like peptidase domain-containing protein [Bacillota bacterium]